MYAVQQPLAASAFDDVMTVPAWKLVPSWYLVAQDDQALPPDAERMFANRMNATTIEVPSGHLAMVSHPADVVKPIGDGQPKALLAATFSTELARRSFPGRPGLTARRAGRLSIQSPESSGERARRGAKISPGLLTASRRW